MVVMRTMGRVVQLGRVRRGRGHGVTWLRDVPAGQLGVDESDGTPPYEDRRGDAEIEWRLGGTGRLVVGAGPRRAGASRAVARAARALLADHVVVGHGATTAPDLPD